MDAEPDTVKQALHDLIWIRAVQDMPPAKAVGALYLLKDILRSDVLPECLKPELAGQNMLNAYLDMESRIDTLGLMALGHVLRGAGTRVQNTSGGSKAKPVAGDSTGQASEGAGGICS